MLIKKILWNFSAIVYHNYLKTLIFIHDRECEQMWNGVQRGDVSLIIRVYLDGEYNDKWIGWHGWPSYIDFFLWGYIKNVVYEYTPTTREDVMKRIRIACRSISRDILLSKTVRYFENSYIFKLISNSSLQQKSPIEEFNRSL